MMMMRRFLFILYITCLSHASAVHVRESYHVSSGGRNNDDGGGRRYGLDDRANPANSRFPIVPQSSAADPNAGMHVHVHYNPAASTVSGTKPPPPYGYGPLPTQSYPQDAPTRPSPYPQDAPPRTSLYHPRPSTDPRPPPYGEYHPEARPTSFPGSSSSSSSSRYQPGAREAGFIPHDHPQHGAPHRKRYDPPRGDYASRKAEYGPHKGEYGSRKGEYGSRKGENGPHKSDYGPQHGKYGPQRSEYGPQRGEYGPHNGDNGYDQYGKDERYRPGYGPLPRYREDGIYTEPYDERRRHDDNTPHSYSKEHTGLRNDARRPPSGPYSSDRDSQRAFPPPWSKPYDRPDNKGGEPVKLMYGPDRPAVGPWTHPSKLYTPDRPYSPDRPDRPYSPDRPDRPFSPDRPDRPFSPDRPYSPDRPDRPYTPDRTYTPDRPDRPYTPDRYDAKSAPDDAPWKREESLRPHLDRYDSNEGYRPHLDREEREKTYRPHLDRHETAKLYRPHLHRHDRTKAANPMSALHVVDSIPASHPSTQLMSSKQSREQSRGRQPVSPKQSPRKGSVMSRSEKSQQQQEQEPEHEHGELHVVDEVQVSLPRKDELDDVAGSGEEEAIYKKSADADAVADAAAADSTPPNCDGMTLSDPRKKMTPGMQALMCRLYKGWGKDMRTSNKWKPTQKQDDWFSSLGSKGGDDRRKKRQVTTGRAVRKEYRALSDEERESFHDAMNRLKNEEMDGLSKYDIFVNFHRATNAPAAHFGAAFLPWHREMLLSKWWKSLLEHENLLSAS